MKVHLRLGFFIVCGAGGLAATCRSHSSPALLFDCRVPSISIRPSIGSAAAAVSTLTSASQLVQLESGRRYAFVVTRNRALTFSLQAKEPSWYEHASLAQGEPVLTAGGMTTTHDRRTVQKVVVDAQSAVYCPTPDSAREAVALVVAAGIPDDRVRVDNRAFSCIDSASSTAVPDGSVRDYGDVMVEIERRFQLAGEAIARRDADTADYYLYALLRSVGEDLQRARTPESRPRPGLENFVQRFIRVDFPPLRQAVWDESWPRARRAFDAAAATCNACHEAANVKFLVVRSPFALHRK